MLSATKYLTFHCSLLTPPSYPSIITDCSPSLPPLYYEDHNLDYTTTQRLPSHPPHLKPLTLITIPKTKSSPEQHSTSTPSHHSLLCLPLFPRPSSENRHVYWITLPPTPPPQSHFVTRSTRVPHVPPRTYYRSSRPARATTSLICPCEYWSPSFPPFLVLVVTSVSHSVPLVTVVFVIVVVELQVEGVCACVCVTIIVITIFSLL